MSTPHLRLEVAALDCFILRLFDSIDEANMPWLLAAAQQLRQAFGAGLIELVPSYTTLLLQFDLLQLTAAQARELIAASLADLQPLAAGGGRQLTLPVWYDRRVGPELDLLARRSGLTVSEVIHRHSAHRYCVFALGFAPGFAFMGLVVPELASPRLDTPRQRVAAGSVGIAERQTAVYPLLSPGGWNLIGRTPTRLFDRELDGYSLLQPGDQVRFAAIEHAEFIRLGGDDTPLAQTQGAS
ncbi:5-oxoprolinase subunit PxpB [Pseudomonas sp. LS44]|uniref:5-oxoprolinase subunit PxpB n=1 Tax=Pseudomonas sp. LS44 TaxID=1357074 RepID=UPI00215A5460|nr:5-oxoprolinase subunit PxpB [Pseudomonas sp. LS44]UVE16452.1 5-oxoprolinase subunit PxpB [Pseudomonas sp. LS44]